MASLSKKKKSVRKSELSVRVTKLSSDWQFARALLEHEYECIDKHQIGSRYEFAKHLLDIHRMWCTACTHSACPDLPVRSNQDPAPAGAAAPAPAAQVQKRIYVSASTQTIDAEMERMNQITVLPVHVLLKEEDSTEEHCEEGISNQHVRSDLQTHIESTNQDSDLLVKQEEPCQEPCNVEMESSSNQSAPHKADEKGIITQQITSGKLWRRTRHCEICFTPTNDMSKHLERVHKLTKEERQTYMLAARSRVPITRRSTNPSDGKQLKRQDCPICPGKHYTRLGDHLKLKHGLNKDQVVEIRKRMKQERKAALKIKINNGFSRSTSNTGEHGPKASQVHYFKGKQFRRMRLCEICSTSTNDMSRHLVTVHKLSKEERQPYILAARSRVPITRRSTIPSCATQLKRQDCPICPGKHYTRIDNHLKKKHGLDKDQVVEIRKRMKQERKAALKTKINNGPFRSANNTGEHGPKSSQVHYYKGKQFRRTRLCEICSTSTNDMSKHLITVHKLSKEERQPYILAARSRVPITRRSTIPSCATQLKRQDCPICPGKHYTRIDSHLKKKHGLDKDQVVEIRKRMKQERKAALKMKINNGPFRSANNTGEHGPKSSQVHFYKGKHWRRTRICEICFTPTNDMSKHLYSVHKLSKEERQPYILAARSRVPVTRRGTIYDPSSVKQLKRQDCPICPGKNYAKIGQHLRGKHGLNTDEVAEIRKKMKKDGKSILENNSDPSSSTQDADEHGSEVPSQASCDPDWATIMELLDLETVLDTNNEPPRSNCNTDEHGPEASTQTQCYTDGKTTFQNSDEPSKSSNDSDEQPVETSFHDYYYKGKNFRRTRPCEICSASTNDMSKHLARVHKLSKEERQTYMLAARSRVPITKHGTIYDPSCAKQPKRQDCPICPGKHYANIRQHLLGKHGLKKDEVAEIWKKMKKDRKSVLQNKRELRRSANNTDERGPDASSQAQSQETDAVAKPYLCSICGKNFKQEWHLSSHIQTHTGEKPFPCSVCAKRYDRKGNLIIHMRTHTGEKPYLCATCGKSFARKGSFNLHMRMHTREKPFLCPICNMRFTRGGNMKRHMRTHRQETPYKCPLCNKGFPFKISLSIHIRKHTEEKPD